jgi:zinc D-Ala-D-Ala dipeptidase
VPLAEITAASHGVVIALACATAMKLTGKPVYRQASCFPHLEAEAKLARAAARAPPLARTPKILDAFCPAKAQWLLRKARPDPDFLAHPARGSPHSRAIAIDLILVDKPGLAPDTGGPLDAFTPPSNHAGIVVSLAQKNRSLLLGLMSGAGWDFYGNECWHYQLFNQGHYPRHGRWRRALAHDVGAGCRCGAIL